MIRDDRVKAKINTEKMISGELTFSEITGNPFFYMFWYLAIFGVPPEKRYQKGLQKLSVGGPSWEVILEPK